jgi:hypothetical protein
VTMLLAVILALSPMWTVTPTDQAPATLSGVTTIADDAWTSGFTLTPGDDGGLAFGPIVRHWNGDTWDTVASAPFNGRFNGIDAVSADDIWAVGDTMPRDADPDGGGLTAHWDGETWSFASFDASFAAVAAVSGADVWAVGSEPVGTTTAPVASHWDGRRWTATPIPVTGDGYLSAVAAVAQNDVWAVGATIGTPVPVQTPLALHWDGHSWQEVTLPSVAERGTARLLGVTTVRGRAWAVGSSTTGGAVNRRPLAFRLDEKSGSLEPLPAEHGQLDAVTTVRSEVWAVGYRIATSEPYGLRLRAGRWEPLPLPTEPGTALTAVAADERVWTVGTKDGPDPNLPIPLAAWSPK